MYKNIFVYAVYFACALSLSLAQAVPNPPAPPAQDFKLSCINVKSGKTEPVQLSKYKDKTVVLEWFNKDCPFVHKMYDSHTMQGLQTAAKGDGVVWLTIVSSAKGKEGFITEKDFKALQDQYHLDSADLCFDPRGDVARKYQAKTTPHMFVISKNSIVYQGAIDDQPVADKASLKGAKNYVAATLAALKKGEAITDSGHAPYGCSIKY